MNHWKRRKREEHRLSGIMGRVGRHSRRLVTENEQKKGGYVLAVTIDVILLLLTIGPAKSNKFSA